jgi:hypothetical protein
MGCVTWCLGCLECFGSKPHNLWRPLGRQLYDAAEDGNTSDVAALLSNPEARSFINWQKRLHVPRRLPLSLLLHCVSVNILAYISL